MGTVVCEMYYDHAPRTCKNFVELVGSYTLYRANERRRNEDITTELLYVPFPKSINKLTN
jgi:hypothetical protein